MNCTEPSHLGLYSKECPDCRGVCNILDMQIMVLVFRVFYIVVKQTDTNLV